MTDTSTRPSLAAALAERRGADPTIVPHVVGGREYFDGALLHREDPINPVAAVTGCYDAPEELVQQAVDASRAAQREWELVPLAERIARVREGIEYVLGQVDDWALRVALEIGKGYTAARSEGLEVADMLRLYCGYAEEPGALYDDRTSTDGKLKNESVLRPYGVFGVISPFNFPVAQPAGPAISAVLAGNGVVLKADHHAPWSGHAIYEMFAAMNLPTGLVNIVHGADSPGKALVSSDVDGISFTGSAEVGSAILRQVAAGPYTRPVIAEMGGKNPVLVTDSADLEAAADGIVFSAFDLAGQKCTALSRVLVTPGAHDRLVDLVTQRAKELRIADPADSDAFAGPLVSSEAVARYERVVAKAREAGFTVAGGDRLDEQNYLVGPAVISSIPEEHELARTEHFLPLITISEVKSFNDGLKAANDVPVGLTSGIYTGDREEARMFLRRSEAGGVNVNVPGHATTLWWPGPQTMGGWKGSGSTGKHAFGKWYLQQFARQQARKLPAELEDLLTD